MIKGKNLILLLLILYFYIVYPQETYYYNKIEVVINEICLNNRNILKDNYNNYSSWIELYNSGKNNFDISGYGLSNEEYIPLKWTFPKNSIINQVNI